MEQGSLEWFEARLGKITASRFGDVLTKGRGSDTFGKVAYSYAYELVAETMTKTWKEINAKQLEWGRECEPEARRIYQLETFDFVKEVGFIEYDNMVGCSPDGLIGKDGCLEIKCPYNSTNHVIALEKKEVPKIYIPQVQGVMMCADRKWCNYVSFDPRFKKESKRIIFIPVKRDEEYIKILRNKIEEFKIIIKTILERCGHEKQ